MNPRLGAVTVVVLAVLAVVSCATSSGTLVDRVLEAEAADEDEEGPAPPPPEGVEGLEIRTDPDGAAVWLNNRYQGTTPLVIGVLKRGTYRLVITHKGYHDTVVWLDYPGGSMAYQIALDPILGFVQVDVNPSVAELTLDDRRISQGITPVPVGSYSVKASAFGYTEWRGRITVWENIVTPIAIDLEPAPFAISTPSVARPVVNPENAGLLGSLEARFDVTGPGSASVTIFDGLGHQVHQESLPEFRTWSQRFRWRPSDAIPDGEYSLVISGLGRDGLESRQESFFTIDQTVRIAPRSSWSGGSGLLYVSTAEALPPRSFQASLVGMAYTNPYKDQLQAPIQLSLRSGLGGHVEFDVAAGAILTGATPPIFGSLSVRWQFVEPTRPVGVGVAVEGKAALQGVPGKGILTTDTFANFSGISLGVPIQVTFGQVSLLVEPAFLASAWQVDYDSDPIWLSSPASWMYWKAGLMVDTGAFVAGISASARSGTLPFGFLSIDPPVQAGVEFHWLLPDTHVLLGGAFAGEFESPTSLYWMGGISLGLLF
jgi:hypothetical protein